MTPKETAELIGTLRIFWPSYPVADVEKMVAAWHMVVGDIPFADMQAAVKTYMRDPNAFFPMPGQLISLIAETRVNHLVPESCFAEVQEQARLVGYGRPPVFRNGEFLPAPEPVFSHPLIAEAVKSVGWQAICQAEGQRAQQEIQKNFLFALKALKENAKIQIKLGPMDGVVFGIDPGVPKGSIVAIQDGKVVGGLVNIGSDK